MVFIVQWVTVRKTVELFAVLCKLILKLPITKHGNCPVVYTAPLWLMLRITVTASQTLEGDKEPNILSPLSTARFHKLQPTTGFSVKRQ